MSKYLNFLDCTIRDGGYYNNWKFSEKFANEYLKCISSTPIKFVEIGFRSSQNKLGKGNFWYTKNKFLKKINIPENIKICLMTNLSDVLYKGKVHKKILKEIFPFNLKNKIHLIRIALHYEEIKHLKKLCSFLKKNNYNFAINLMQISRLDQKDLNKAAKAISAMKPRVFYIADSLGDLDIKKLKSISVIIKKHWNGEIGIHAHNNLNLALKNSKFAIKEGFTWVDSTLMGMGRGAGNLRTEDLLKVIAKYKITKNFQNFQKSFMNSLKKLYNWGPNKYYKFSAMCQIHPTYVQEMLSDERYSNNKIIGILKKIKNTNSYNPDIIENLSQRKFGNQNILNFKKINFKKNILLLANTKSLKAEKKIVENFIKKTKPTVIALNFNHIIKQKFIDFFVACHGLRFAEDFKNYKDVSKPLIIPKNLFNIYKYKFSKLKKIINFECIINHKLDYCLSIQNYSIPNQMTLAYILGICLLKKIHQITFAGFEGYKEKKIQFSENQQLLRNFSQNFKKKIKLRFITKTKYKLN